jgi:hypothetical protein
MKEEILPDPSTSSVIKRVEASELPAKYLRWTGNDDNYRRHDGKVRVSDRPLYLHLSWRSHRNASPQFVGCFRINVEELVSAGLAKAEGDDHARLRIYHDRDGILHLRWRANKSAVPIARL